MVMVMEDLVVAVVAEGPPNMRKRSSTFRYGGAAYLADRSTMVRQVLYAGGEGEIARQVGSGDGDGDGDVGGDTLFSSGRAAGGGIRGAMGGDGAGEHASEDLGEDAGKDADEDADEDVDEDRLVCICLGQFSRRC